MVSEKQIEAAADQISEGLGAFLRKFCDSEASKRARHYLHEMPKDEWNQMALMLATEALTAAEQAEPATDVGAFESCPDCAGSGYSNHPDSGQVCYRCNGQGSYTHPTPSEARTGGLQ